MANFLFRLLGGNCILKRLDNIENFIINMAIKFTEYVTRQNARDTKMAGSLAALKKGFAAQAAEIERLQNTPDGWTPEDQASLDTIEANGDSLVEGFTALEALVSTPVEPPAA